MLETHPAAKNFMQLDINWLLTALTWHGNGRRSYWIFFSAFAELNICELLYICILVDWRWSRRETIRPSEQRRTTRRVWVSRSIIKRFPGISFSAFFSFSFSFPSPPFFLSSSNWHSLLSYGDGIFERQLFTLSVLYTYVYRDSIVGQRHLMAEERSFIHTKNNLLHLHFQQNISPSCSVSSLSWKDS